MTEEKKAYASKVGITIAMAVLTGVLTGAGTAVYKHELAILKNARHIERLSVKDYRQHRDSLRLWVRIFSQMESQLEVVLEVEPDAFGPNSRLILKQRKEQLAHARRRLDNYVEENKHGGRDD